METIENPENLGGLGDVLPAEVLKKLNQLLEMIHQAGGNKQGSKIEIVYVASGGQHVDHVDNQYFIGEKWTERPKADKPDYPALPEVLATDAAMSLWKKVQAAGYVDDHYQPLISRTQSALLADSMAERLGIMEKWKVFEALWRRKNMRGDYNDALNQRQTLAFHEKLKRVFSD